MKNWFFIPAAFLCLGLSSVRGQVNLTPEQLFPPGDTAWNLEGLGITGTVSFKLLVEQSGSASANSFLFDGQANGFPGGVGTSTDDLVVFTPADNPGKFAVVTIPPGANLALFHDITDASGVFLSGPNGVLDTNDAYLNSNPARNYTRVGADQLIKYYGANQFLSYEFTAFGQTVQLGSGFIAFIFIEEDHTPNYDYNDMIIGILPPCNADRNCDDGLFCNGVERCVFPNTATGGLCMGGTPPVCDDGVACTFDECHEQLHGYTCVYKPHDQDCDDHNFCNGTEQCDATLGCLPGKPVDCSDGVDCTLDTCVEKGLCVHTPQDSFCDDHDFCNGTETCHRKKGCQVGPAPVCNDGLACTTDTCDSQAGSCVFTPNDSCDDGQFCNGVETCDPVLGCKPGQIPNCDDGIPCTIDSCSPQLNACQHIPNDSLCSNGLFCDGTETCNPQTGCVPGTPPNCSDDVSCTNDSCDEVNDSCLHQPDSTHCNDGLYCNGEERCDAILGCQAGTPPNCNDSVGCTVDNCDEVNDRCVNTPDSSLCNDDAFCNGIEVCDPVQGCQSGTPPVCNDGIACTNDRCNPQLNACEFIPDDSICADGLYCDGVETCNPATGCVPGTPIDCHDTNECTTDICDEAIDQCVHTPENSACDDGLFCTGLETCGPAGCQPGLPPCASGSLCDEEGNGCPSCLSDEDCVSELFCNGIGHCIDNACVFTPPSCDDGIDCTNDRCNPETDACEHTLDNSRCTNGAFCDGVETCTLQGCVPGTPVDCNDGIACTLDACNEAKDLCTHTPQDNACNDGLFCNGTEVCHPTQGCQPGVPPNCNDLLGCTIDTCDEAADRCDHACSTPQITCTNQEFECDNVGSFLPPVVDDPCSVNPVATCTDVTTPGKLPQEYTVTRTCSFTNDCANSATCQQVVKVVDTTPPQITCPPDQRVECDAIIVPGEPIVSDNCNPDPQVKVVVEEIVGDCTPTTAGISPPPKLIKLNTYTVSDGSNLFAEGNTADGDTTGNTATCTQRIEIIDTHAPFIVACPTSMSACLEQPLAFTPPACNDTCGTCSVICTRSDGLPLGAPPPNGPLTIQCLAHDECQNASLPCDIAVVAEDCDNDIPTISQWGLVILTLLLLIGAKLRFATRHSGLTF